MSFKTSITVLIFGKNQTLSSIINQLNNNSNYSIQAESTNDHYEFIDIFNESYAEYKNEIVCIFNLNNSSSEEVILQYINSECPQCKNIIIYDNNPWLNAINLLNNNLINGMINSHKHEEIKTCLLKSFNEIANLKQLKLNNYFLNKKLLSVSNELSGRTTELLKKNITLKNLSVTDKLTQIANRLKLDTQLRFNFEYFKRYNSDFSIILIDIDHFKQVNDSYGHQTGDLVLIEMANILTTNVRNTDMAGRWGGEEFLILCPNSNIEDSIHLAEKLRKKIEKYDFKKIGQKTSSFGVSSFKKGDLEEDIIARADKALYKAKQNGRNRVESF